MKLTTKTVQIFLSGGDSRGSRMAEITTRMTNCNKNKEFRERAVIVTSKTNSMTQAADGSVSHGAFVRESST